MNIIKYINLSSNHHSTSNMQNEGMLQLCTEYYRQIIEETDKDILSVHSVWGYLRHIPREKCTMGYSKEVYSMANKCFERLYHYSQKKNFFGETITKEEFLYKDWYHNTRV